MSRGVPQGALISPTLFAYHFHVTVRTALENMNFYAGYADDFLLID